MLGDNVTLGREAEQLGDLDGLLPHLAVVSERGEEVRATPEPRDDRDLERLRDGEIGEDVHELKAPGDAEPREGHRPDPVDVPSLKRTAPDVGRNVPVRTLISVDLPAPLGPMIETNSPSRMPRLTPASAQKSP